MENKNILIVEDEEELSALLKLHLSDQGATVHTAADGNLGLQKINNHRWDLIILDIQLPGPSGLDLCRTIRRQQAYTPVMMLTSRSTELDRVIGLDLGADDYVTKPFSLLEMLSRIKAQFRRIDHYFPGLQASADSTEALAIGELRIDEKSRRVWLADETVELTGKEFDLLLHFASHPNRVFRRTELLDSVWGYGHEGYEHTVNCHINRLRAKIEPSSSDKQYIQTVWGVGYKLVEPVTDKVTA